MASVKATRTLAQKLNSISGTWVKDPFRPNLQLQTLLQSLATHPNLTHRVVLAARTLRDNNPYKEVCFSREPSRLTSDLDAFYLF